MDQYSGPGNIHSDIEVARSVGLDRTIAQGMQTLALASELMTQIHGRAWLESGHVAVTFTSPVYAGDTVTVRVDGGRIEAVNQDGQTVMVGSAVLG